MYAWMGIKWYGHDVLGARLPAGCEVLFIGAETQMVFTVVVGCPGKDLVRLWPLPIQKAYSIET